MSITFGSLFAGIGGIDLGLERAGMTCKWQVEIEPFAQRVLAKHWPDVRRWDDVRTWPQGDTEPVDLIAAGFPCQDISYAGKGAGLDGERSGLFFEVARIIGEMGPRYVLLENVSALLTRGLGDVLGALASFGYDAEWHCIPAAAVGAPHVRDRVFIIAYSNADGRDVPNSDSKRRRMRKTDRKDATHAWKPPSRKEFRQWGTEPDVGRVANGISSRVDRLKGLGNAVVPQVAEYIGRQLKQCNDALAN